MRHRERRRRLPRGGDYILKLRGRRRSSSTAFRRARCAPRCSPSAIPDRVARLALDAFVWTGEGSPTLDERRKKLPEFLEEPAADRPRLRAQHLRRATIPGTAERVIDAFADAILALDDSVPTGTYVDMCSKLPVVDPEKITVPTLIMRGQWDGIASFDDLIEFFKRLPNPDKQFTVMPGISHASFQQKNY